MKNELELYKEHLEKCFSLAKINENNIEMGIYYICISVFLNYYKNQLIKKNSANALKRVFSKKTKN